MVHSEGMGGNMRDCGTKKKVKEEPHKKFKSNPYQHYTQQPVLQSVLDKF
jgi:hypothetical protein